MGWTPVRHWRIITLMVVLETSLFTRQVTETLSDDDYARLQAVLTARPDTGAVIRGSGGLRKIRWATSGKGKRGGVRIIYYWAPAQEQLLMLMLFSKNERANLTQAQVKVLRKLVDEEYP
jgi:hypothetical protein